MAELDLKSPKALSDLPTRYAPYWHTIEYCRHIGFQKRIGFPSYWMARVRKKDGGYCQTQLAPYATDDSAVDYSRALALAEAWFERPEIQEIASPSYPVGSVQHLKYTKRVQEFTVGDALADYVEWKRIAAKRSHFETNLSLINFHIVPRLGDLPLDHLTARKFTKFCRDVLETPPKRGNQPLGPKRPIDQLTQEELRKRKKTVNALVGILRLAVQMAWENGDTDNERAWRCLRRIPSVDVPRQIFLTREECRRLVACCRDDLAQLVLGALYSGCRVSELAAMQVGDVGGDIRGLYVRPSKNGRSRRVFLPSEGVSFFLGVCGNRSAAELVFKMNSGKGWRGSHRHLFREAVTKAELPSSFVFHGLRHTYASQLVQSGMPLAIVARQLGHSNTDTVSRTYGHLSVASIESELERRFTRIVGGNSELSLRADGRFSEGMPSKSSPLTLS